MDAPRFIKSQHPRHSISNSADEIDRILKLGWIAQVKMNGHRLQIQISPSGELTCFTRHGTLHTAKLSPELTDAFKHYKDKSGFIVLEGEWMKGMNQVHLFDCLRYDNQTLQFHTYQERYKILKDLFRISPSIKLLSILKSKNNCLAMLQSDDEKIEGLVFKSWKSKGWPDSAIVRCLKS